MATATRFVLSWSTGRTFQVFVAQRFYCFSSAHSTMTASNASHYFLQSSSYFTSSQEPNRNPKEGTYQAANGEVGRLKRGWRYAVGVVKSFVRGMKLLIADVKSMRALKKKTKGFQLDGEHPSSHLGTDDITCKDLQFINKTTADLKRTLPALVLFWIPLVGYVAPFLALAFPGQLLSSHFWSEKQKRDFKKRNVEQRQDNIVKLKGYVMFDNKDKSDHLNKIILDCLTKIEAGGTNWNELNESPVHGISLNQLSSKHLVLLSHTWGVRSILPSSWWLRRKLTKHFNYIFACDCLLSAQTNDQIDTQLFDKFLEERCIDKNSIKEPLEVLRKWVSIVDASKKCPYTLLGHLPLVWTKLH